MKKTVYEKLNIAIFLAIIILPGIVWFFVCIVLGADKLNRMFGELSENRNLTPRPAQITDTRGWEEYYNDRLPFRNAIVIADNDLESGIEKHFRKSVMPGLVRMLGLKADEKKEASVTATLMDNGKSVEKIATEPKKADTVGTVHEHTWQIADSRSASYTDYGRNLYVCSECGERKWDDFEDKLIDEDYYPVSLAANSVLFGKYDWLFYSNDNALDYFEGKMLLDAASKERVLSDMERLRAECEKRGISLVLMIAPNREQVYPEYMPTLKVLDGDKREEDLVGYIKANSNINIIYPLDDLKRANVFYDTCYRYDSHWNHWGAFVGTESLYIAIDADNVAPESVPVSEEYTTMAGLIASGALNPADFEPAKDYFPDYRPEAGATVIEGQQDIAKGYTAYYEAVSTDPTDERSIAIIGDSFRVSMLRYIEKDFAKSVSIQKEAILAGPDGNEPDMWEKIIGSIENTDVLVVETVERYDNEWFTIISKLAGYLGN